MSLKAFHIVFVTASVLMSLGFAAWSFNRYFSEHQALDLIFGAGAALAAVGLIFYGRYFLKKLKNISYL